MKKYFLILVLICSCQTNKYVTSTTIEKPIVLEKNFAFVSLNDVETLIKNRAFDLGSRLLEACNSSKFKPFSSEEATESVIQNATSRKISETCKKINFRNGKFQGLNLIEVKHDQINNIYIFRYSIDYEKSYFKRELLVSVDSLKKVTKIITKEMKRKPM